MSSALWRFGAQSFRQRRKPRLVPRRVFGLLCYADSEAIRSFLPTTPTRR